ncbi:hypothetical protein PIB30_104255, partial [Stylosanthes scabra]|nr:hypothetical protein [Stylosanthes scabra]
GSQHTFPLGQGKGQSLQTTISSISTARSSEGPGRSKPPTRNTKPPQLQMFQLQACRPRNAQFQRRKARALQNLQPAPSTGDPKGSLPSVVRFFKKLRKRKSLHLVVTQSRKRLKKAPKKLQRKHHRGQQSRKIPRRQLKGMPKTKIIWQTSRHRWISVPRAMIGTTTGTMTVTSTTGGTPNQPPAPLEAAPDHLLQATRRVIAPP